MATPGRPGGCGRRLRPPAGLTPLDRAWRRQGRRLQQAHDDWALHATGGDPRRAIHRAAGLVRLRRRAARDGLRACRMAAMRSGARTDTMTDTRRRAADCVRAYRAAVAELAGAVAAFDAANALLASMSGMDTETGP